MTRENQTTITEWTDKTFGVKHPLVVAARMNVEVAELLMALAQATHPKYMRSDLQHLLQLNLRTAEAFCTEIGRNEYRYDEGDKGGNIGTLCEPVQVADFEEKLNRDAQFECADVMIMLSQVIEKIGGNLSDLVDEKMRVNRNRSWAKVGGRYQHTDKVEV